MFPRFVSKLFCNEWWVWFYVEEHLSVLVEKCNTQLESELNAAKRNVTLFESKINQ